MLRASICAVAWWRGSLRGGVVARLRRFYLADRQLHALGCANRRVFKIVMNVVVARARRVRPIRDTSCGTSRGPSRARHAALRLHAIAIFLGAPGAYLHRALSFAAQFQHTPPHHNTPHHTTARNITQQKHAQARSVRS
jgi:hypothetical protein